MVKEGLALSKKMGSGYLAFILFLVLIPFLPVLLADGEKVLSDKDNDIAHQFYAYKHFLQEEIHHGRLPLWNPYLLCGNEFHGEGQPALFYPTTWALSLFSPATAINLHFLLHSWLLAAALYLFLRELGLTRGASFLGSLVFALSSAPVLRIYAGHFPNFPALALAPLFLLFWEKFLKRREWRNLLFMSLTYACLVLAGHAQFLFYFSLFFLFYSLWGIFSDSQADRRTKGKNIFGFALALFLGILIAAVHLLPALDFAENSFRHRMTFEFCSMFSFAPENFLTLLYPAFFGDGVESAYWGRNYLWEMAAYIGVIPFLFAALGAIYSPRPRRLLWVVALFLFFLLALGKHTPLFSLLYRFFPLFDKFRGSSKFMSLAVFSLSVLAAYGFEFLFGRTEAKGKKAPPSLKKIFQTGAILSLALALISGWLWWNLSGFESWNSLVQWRYQQGETFGKPILKEEKELRTAQTVGRRSVALTMLLALGAALYFGFFGRRKRIDSPWGKWLLTAGILFDLLWFGWKYYATFSVEEIRPPRELVELMSKEQDLFRVVAPSLPANTFMLAGVESMGGYVGNVLERYNRFLDRAQGLPEEYLQSPSRITRYAPAFQLLNVKYLILPSKVRFETPSFQRLSFPGDLAVYQNRALIPRVYFPQRVGFVESSSEALALAAEGGIDPQELTILEDRARAGEKIDYGEARGEYKLRRYTPNEIQLEVQSSRPRLMVVANSFSHGWRASIDGGSPSPVVPANYVLQAIPVPEGSHLVQISFFPDSLRWGIILSAIGLLAWVLLYIWGRRLIRFI